MVKVLEAVPNFSEGKDLSKIQALVDTIARAGVEVLDWSADPDHHRCVVTYVGDPGAVAKASVDAARFARDHIDLRGHTGVHPRVGALDVMPFVPLHAMDMAEAVTVAHRVGQGIADLGVPVIYYRAAADPPGRRLGDLRRGGFESLAEGFPEGQEPDLPVGTQRPHESAGVTCVGAREVLLAWNVFVEGIEVCDAKSIAGSIREQNGGFPGPKSSRIAPSRPESCTDLYEPRRSSSHTAYRGLRDHCARSRVIGGQSPRNSSDRDDP